MLNDQLIFLDIDCTSKTEVLDLIIEKNRILGYINDFEEVKKTVLLREKAAPTEVGLSIAIPHGRNQYINEPTISFARLKNSIKWEKESVDLIFLILVPQDKAEKIHLKYISELSRSLLDDEFREMLYTVKDNKEINENIGG